MGCSTFRHKGSGEKKVAPRILEEKIRWKMKGLELEREVLLERIGKKLSTPLSGLSQEKIRPVVERRINELKGDRERLIWDMLPTEGQWGASGIGAFFISIGTPMVLLGKNKDVIGIGIASLLFGGFLGLGALISWIPLVLANWREIKRLRKELKEVERAWEKVNNIEVMLAALGKVLRVV